MRVSFPYMGATIIYGKLLELLGHEVIMPPRPTRKTIELGVKYGPEFACFPFKVLLVPIWNAWIRGNLFVTTGGQGPAGQVLWELHKRSLRIWVMRWILLSLTHPGGF